jgi:hypothetical protein
LQNRFDSFVIEQKTIFNKIKEFNNQKNENEKDKNRSINQIVSQKNKTDYSY